MWPWSWTDPGLNMPSLDDSLNLVKMLPSVYYGVQDDLVNFVIWPYLRFFTQLTFMTLVVLQEALMLAINLLMIYHGPYWHPEL